MTSKPIQSKGNPKRFGTILRSNNEVDKKVSGIYTFSPVDVEHPPIPKELDGRSKWRGLLSPIYDQGTCGACYSFSVVSTLADRYAIQSMGQVRPVFNPLELIMCLIDAKDSEEFHKIFSNYNKLVEHEETQSTKTCEGNTLVAAAEHIYRSGAVETNCIPMDYIRSFWNENGSMPLCVNVEGPGMNRCLQTDPILKKTAQRSWPAKLFYKVMDTTEGQVGEELNNCIMLDIMRWGPMATGFNVFQDFLEYDGKSIYIPKPDQEVLGGHAIKIVGWGEEKPNGDVIKYWICANSWGPDWGDNGYFKIQRSNKLLAFESNHLSLRPQVIFRDEPNPPLHMIIPTPDDIKERLYEDIDPLTFYNKSNLPLIKNGTLIGDLSPVIDESKLPKYKDFWAYRLDLATLKMPRLSETSSSNWTWVIIVFIIAIGLGIFFYTKYRR